jgi:hypothetical protein
LVCSAGKVGRKYITAHERCPASFANDPAGAENTKHIEPNCDFVENPGIGFDNENRVSLQCTRDIDASVEQPATLWVNYHTIEHTYEKSSKKSADKTVVVEKVISPSKLKLASAGATR